MFLSKLLVIFIFLNLFLFKLPNLKLIDKKGAKQNLLINPN